MSENYSKIDFLLFFADIAIDTMGNESAKTLSPNELSDLKEQTTFSRTEIRDLYKKFTKDCPNGQMTVEEFKAMYETLFPEGDSGQFADHVFKAYDKDGNGVIDFQVNTNSGVFHWIDLST